MSEGRVAVAWLLLVLRNARRVGRRARFRPFGRRPRPRGDRYQPAARPILTTHPSVVQRDLQRRRGKYVPGTWYKRGARAGRAPDRPGLDAACYKRLYELRLAALVKTEGAAKLAKNVPRISGELRGSAEGSRVAGVYRFGFDTPYSHFVSFRRRGGGRRRRRRFRFRGRSEDCADAVRKYLGSGDLRRLERKARAYALKYCTR